jgi:lipoate-protein ligase A
MLDSEIDHVVSALKVKKDKIESKGIKSIRSRVANISEFLDEKLTMAEFRHHLLQYIFEGQEDIPEYVLTSHDWEQIEKLSKERYQSWDWNYGMSPKFNIQRTHRFPVGSIDVRLEVNKGVIENCKIYGDFFGTGDVHDIEKQLIGQKYEKAALQAVLNEIDVATYFGKITQQDFLNLLY